MAEDKVLDDLNKVFAAKRLANMVRVLISVFLLEY